MEKYLFIPNQSFNFHIVKVEAIPHIDSAGKIIRYTIPNYNKIRNRPSKFYSSTLNVNYFFDSSAEAQTFARAKMSLLQKEKQDQLTKDLDLLQKKIEKLINHQTKMKYKDYTKYI